LKKEAVFSLWVILAGIFWVANYFYSSTYLEKAFYTFLVLSIIYLIFKILLQEKIAKTIKDKKTKYSFAKVISVLYIAIFVIVLITIWVENPQDITVAYGLTGAGIAIALQDLFKNIAGGVVLFLTGIYRVGDRIEINGKAGDVMDIGILYTTILEIKDWVSGDQATGRLVSIPNGQVLSTSINNYTKDHNFIWDELHIPIAYSNDWKIAHNSILNIVKEQTKETVEKANKEIAGLEEKYYLDKRTAEPAIYLTSTDNWISFNIRYPTEVRSRRFFRDKITRLVLEDLAKKKIKIASTTLDIVGFPEISIKESKKQT
jgi:small-conductance mechanosensitive channel